jgi:hypothetical protein
MVKGTYVSHGSTREKGMISIPDRYHRRRTRSVSPRVGHCGRYCDLWRGPGGKAIFEYPVAAAPLLEELSSQNPQIEERINDERDLKLACCLLQAFFRFFPIYINVQESRVDYMTTLCAPSRTTFTFYSTLFINAACGLQDFRRCHSCLVISKRIQPLQRIFNIVLSK